MEGGVDSRLDRGIEWTCETAKVAGKKKSGEVHVYIISIPWSKGGFVGVEEAA